MPRTCTMNIVKLRKLHGPSSSLWMSPGAQRLKDGTNKKNSTAPTTAHPQKDASLLVMIATTMKRLPVKVRRYSLLELLEQKCSVLELWANQWVHS